MPNTSLSRLRLKFVWFRLTGFESHSWLPRLKLVWFRRTGVLSADWVLIPYHGRPKPVVEPVHLGELRHLDMLPPSHLDSRQPTPTTPSPAPGLSRNGSFQLPASVSPHARQDTPQLAPTKRIVSAPQTPASGHRRVGQGRGEGDPPLNKSRLLPKEVSPRST